MATLFAAAKDEYFEDGMESEFSRRLIRLLGEYGEKAVIELAFLILHDQVNAEIASEALRWLGHMEDTRSYQKRLWLLERSLFTPSARIRDGAALGLASLDDPHAVRYLRRAIDQESYPELRSDMEQVLAQLETGS
jgi:HEAT repeat protein